MADEIKPLLADGGTLAQQTPEQIAAAETESYAKTLTTPGRKREWRSLLPEQRTAKISESKAKASIDEYTKGLKPVEKAEFDKLAPEAKAAKIAEVKKAAADADAKANAVPEKYDFKLPEGVKDEGLIANISPILKELGLSQAKAQKLVDSYVKASQEHQAVASKQLVEMQTKWRSEFTSPEGAKGSRFGKKGVDYAASKDPGLKEFLNSWVGDNPSLIRAFAALGEAIGEDTVLQHGRGKAGGGDGKKSTAELMYDKTPAK